MSDTRGEKDKSHQDSPPAASFLVKGQSKVATFNSTPTGNLLQRLLYVTNRDDEDAKNTYQALIQEMREKAEDIVMEIARMDKVFQQDNYLMRWTLIHVASEMKHESTLPFLTDIVLSPISPDISNKPHLFSGIGAEMILRTTAIDGIGQLAGDGNDLAFKALFEFLKLPWLSVRRAAVQFILSVSNDDQTRNKIVSLLPENQKFLLDLKPMDVRDVPQMSDPRLSNRQGINKDVQRQPRPTVDEDNSRINDDNNAPPKAK